MTRLGAERLPNPWLWTLCVVGSVYAHSSIHRLAGGDSGELLAEACVGGVAHPPGYPLLLLALRATRWISSYVAPNVQFVVSANCLNAAFAAGAAACVTHTVTLVMGGNTWVGAIAAGLLFAFSALTWEYALGLEVFALNNLIVGLLLVCFVRHFLRPQSTTNLCMGAFLCGLGLSNQHTCVLFEIPMILWILATSRPRFLDWLCLTASFLLGLSPYIYAVHTAQTPTPSSWGDTSTLHGLWTHFLRREYGTFQLSPLKSSSANFASRLFFYFEDLTREFTVFGIIFALLGISTSVRSVASRATVRVDEAVRSKSQPATPTATMAASRLPLAVSRALLIVSSFYILVFNALANLPLSEPLTREITRRFFLQPNMVVAVWIGLGFGYLRNRLLPSGAARLVTLASLSLVVHQYHRNHHTFTTSSIAQHNVVRGFGSSILESLPKDAILLSYTDIQWNAVRYLQQCERARTDVVHLNLQIMAFPWFQRQQRLYPSVTFPTNLPDVSTNRSAPGFASYLTRFVHANLALRKQKKSTRRSIYLDLHGVDEATISGEQLLFDRLQVLPHGLVWHIVQSTTQSPENPQQLQRAWHKYAQHKPAEQLEDADLLRRCCGLTTTGARPPRDIPRGSWEFVVVSIAHDAMYQRALTRLGFWLTHGSHITSVAQLDEAVVAYGSIQHELNELVLAGAKIMHGAISYDLYAVEKNAVVSRQRFQLYLEALADLAESNTLDLTAHAKNYMEKRTVSRRETIAQVRPFVKVMEAKHDEDVEMLRTALDTMQTKDQASASSKATQKKKKRGNRKKQATPRRTIT